MRPHIYIATHHKSGTTWLKTVFRRVADAVGFRFEHLNRTVPGWSYREDRDPCFEERRALLESESEGPVIFFDFKALPPSLERCNAERGVRGLQMIRDPRDMLLSAIRHHLKGDEKWLDEPDFRGGMTFREFLKSRETRAEQIEFELDTHLGHGIRRMANFDKQGVFRVVRYEDLMGDRDMLLFHQVCIGLGFEGEELIKAQRAFWQSSLFGKFGKRVEQGGVGHVHDGSVSQWKTQMSDAEIELVHAVVGDEIDRLGYGAADRVSAPSL